jgi:SpoU rRNA methylase family enzyme
MELSKKLILEELEDEVEVSVPDIIAETNSKLTEEEKENFHIGTITDILNKYLETYSSIKSIIALPDIKEDIKEALNSVSDDTALIIGKLQECLKLSSEGNDSELIAQGEQEVKNNNVETEE